MRTQNPRRTVHHGLVLAIALSAGSCAAPGDSPRDSNEPALDSRGPAGQATVESPLTAELLANISGAEAKIVALADEFTQEQYDWRPAEGVRTAAEVFMHVAALNYAFPLFVGHEAPASTGLTMANLATAAPAYEISRHSKVAVRPELSGSFENLRAAVGSPSAANLERRVTVFGDSTTLRAFWIDHITHLHQHLGQLIAYSRANGVVPPWSQ